MAKKTSIEGKESPRKTTKGTCKYSEADVIKAIAGTGGIISTICEKLNCSRGTFYGYLKKRPAIKQAYEDEQESVLDMAEGSLFGLIQGGDLGAICFYLKCKGKARGFVEKQELDLNHKQPPKVEVVLNAPGTTPEAK